jgi:hypothetical protein
MTTRRIQSQRAAVAQARVAPVAEAEARRIAELAVGRSVPSLEAAVAEKQDVLVSGANIRTVNGSSLLGSGDLVVSASVLAGSAVLTVPNNSIAASVTVTAAVVPTSRIVVVLGTMLDADENAAELLDVASLAAVPGTGSFVIHASFLTPTAGAVPINWSVI